MITDLMTISKDYLETLNSYRQEYYQTSEKYDRFKKLSKRIGWTIILCLVILFISIIIKSNIIFMLFAVLGMLFSLIFAATIIFITNLIITKVKKKKLEEIVSQRATFYKKNIIPILIESINKSIKYTPDKHIDLEEFTALGITGNEIIIPVVAGEDHFSGKISNVDVEFSEVLLSNYKLSVDGEEVPLKNRKRGIKFKGILLKAEFNKNFNGITKVLPVGNTLIAKALKTVYDPRKYDNDLEVSLTNTTTEDINFNKYFEIYTSDAIEAHYILSPKLIELIVQLKGQFSNESVSLVFKNNTLYVAINLQKDFFEPFDIKKNVYDHQHLIEKSFSEIKLCLEIVKQLDLETKIWSRE